MTDRTKPCAAYWTTVALVAIVLYVVSFGPAHWLSMRRIINREVVSIAYQPVVWVASKNAHVESAILWYASLGTRATRAEIVDCKIIWWLPRHRLRLFDTSQAGVRPPEIVLHPQGDR